MFVQDIHKGTDEVIIYSAHKRFNYETKSYKIQVKLHIPTFTFPYLIDNNTSIRTYYKAKNLI